MIFPAFAHVPAYPLVFPLFWGAFALFLLDVVFEGTSAASAKQDKAEAFDADAAIATGELVELIPELLEALGGELAPGSMSQGTAVPEVARSSSVQDSVAAGEAAEAPPWA